MYIAQQSDVFNVFNSMVTKWNSTPIHLKYHYLYKHLFNHFITVVILVQFSNTTYSGSEESGVVPVTLLLEGGASPFAITVTVMPFNQSPISAEGKKFAYSLIINYLVLGWLGNGVDYTSTPIDAIFAVGSTNTTINIPVTKDNISEPTETFSLNFNIPLSLRNRVHTDFNIPLSLHNRVHAGSPNTATGNIEDSTGKTIYLLINLNPN